MTGVPTALAAKKDPTISPPSCNPRKYQVDSYLSELLKLIVCTENRPAEKNGRQHEDQDNATGGLKPATFFQGVICLSAVRRQ